jgi:hypothetical protein
MVSQQDVQFWPDGGEVARLDFDDEVTAHNVHQKAVYPNLLEVAFVCI